MTTLTVDHRLPVALEEPSDATALSEGGFLVVSDTERRAAVVRAGSTAYLTLDGLARGESGLEAVTFDPAAGLLFSFAEERGELFVHRWDGGATSAAVLDRRVALRLGKKENKGVEGMVHLGAEHSPTGRSGLLLANEDKPRRLFFLHDGEETPAAVTMDRGILGACEDFSGLAWDPKRRTVLVVSDESAALVELRLEAAGDAITATTVEAFALEDESGDALERVEGVVVDEAGAWWVLLENDCVLCRLRR